MNAATPTLDLERAVPDRTGRQAATSRTGQAGSLRALSAGLYPLLAHAALFSLVVNVLLVVPSLFSLQVFDRVLTSRSQETLTLLLALTAFSLAVIMVLEAARSRLLAAASVSLDRALGTRILSGLLEQAAHSRGAEFDHGMRDVATLRGFLSGPGVCSLFDAPWLPVFLIVIFLLHPLLGSLALAGATSLIVIAWLNERLMRGAIEQAMTHGRRAGRFVDSSLRNAEAVRGLGMTGTVAQRWTQLNEATLASQQSTSRVAARFTAASRMLRQVLQIVMMAAAAYLAIHQEITPGTMIAASLLLSRAFQPVEAIIGGWRSLVEARAAYRHLDQLLRAHTRQAAATELPAPSGAVSLERVVFGIGYGARPIIAGVSLDIAAGDSIALIGPSASGKSSLARLLVGVWNPVSGTVRLDGADLRQWPRDRLGLYVGYLPQDVELFAGTIAENIARLGDVDSERVIDAARLAHAHEMILRLPGGYDTVIGEGGAGLSAGQCQRIGLARALYGEPKLVVLDEPNANLDAEGEAALARTTATLKQAGVTQVLVTHRPSLAQHVDKVLVLQEGQVQMFGPRQEVLARLRGQVPGDSPLHVVGGVAQRN
jgi:PrtD family type I secretion system ABC transporter